MYFVTIDGDWFRNYSSKQQAVAAAEGLAADGDAMIEVCEQSTGETVWSSEELQD